MAKIKTPQLVDNVAESSDEEIDEDLAFNSDDERMYGEMFQPKMSAKRKRGQQPKQKKQSKLGADFESEESSIDDEESDNENNESDESDDDGIASDDDDDDGDGGQFMLDMLNNLDKKETDNQKEVEDLRALMAHSTKVPESEFAAASNSNNQHTNTLTLDQLMNGITDTKGFKSVKNVMKDMTSSDIYDNDAFQTNALSTTKTPVAKIISERAERKVHYIEQSKNVSGWTEVVKQNREAETLDFRPKDRIRMNKAELVHKFEPTTDFEKEIAAALEEAGVADESEMMKREEEAMFGNKNDASGFDDDDEDGDDDLGRNKLSQEDYQKRLNQLKKMRALMFYEEQKRHHMNKIKSKKYRKIRKKQKLRSKEDDDRHAAEQDEDVARELEEKAEMERMKERMSLKHRNTSKWAKRVLRRGGNVDSETRKALSEQIRIGDELKKKMEGHFNDSDGDDNTDLLSQAKNILAQTENDDPAGQKDKGIFKLAFMKKGIEAQRQRAKDEARELLHELEGNESDGESGSKSGGEEDKEEAASKTSSKKTTASAKEMKKVLAEGKLVASSLKFGNSNSVQVSGDIDIGMQEMPPTMTESESKIISLTTVDTNTATASVEESVSTVNDTKSKVTTPKNVASTSTIETESNPWLLPDPNEKKTKEGSTGSGSKRKKQKTTGPSVSKRGIVNVADAVNIMSGNDNDNNHDNDNDTHQKHSSKIDPNTKIVSLTQEELVRKAFATPSEKDIEDEFNSEKETMKNRDDHSKKAQESSKFVSGWGAWAGEGAPAARPPKKKLPKRLAAPEKKKIKRRKRQDDGKKNVIINAKRMKKTAKFQLEKIPYPYTSREQYEKAMSGAIGKEWNVTTAVKNMTRSEVITKPGKMIKPISKKAKMKRAPAKF